MSDILGYGIETDKGYLLRGGKKFSARNGHLIRIYPSRRKAMLAGKKLQGGAKGRDSWLADDEFAIVQIVADYD